MVFIDVPNYSVLSQGMVVKNYKALCELLGAKTYGSGSASQKAQYKEFARFFSWEKNGHKFIIKEVYKQPLAKQTRQNKFNQHMEPLILSLYRKKEKPDIEKTRNQLFQDLGLRNSKYATADWEKLRKYGTIPGITKRLYDLFRLRCDSRSVQCVDSVLNSMQKRGILTWETSIMTYMEGFGWEHANEEIVKIINDTEQKVLATMGFPDKITMTFSGKFDEYKKQVNAILFGDEDTTDNYAKAYKIHFLNLPATPLSNEEHMEHRNSVNTVWLNTMSEDAEHRYTISLKKAEQKRRENEEKCLLGRPASDKVFQLPDNYIEVQESLQNQLLK